MKLKIIINMDNAAFEADGATRRFRNAYEPALILRKLTFDWPGRTLEAGESFNLRDTNGNTVGEAKVTR